jgi:hypothetical protein
MDRLSEKDLEGMSTTSLMMLIAVMIEQGLPELEKGIEGFVKVYGPSHPIPANLLIIEEATEKLQRAIMSEIAEKAAPVRQTEPEE